VILCAIYARHHLVTIPEVRYLAAKVGRREWDGGSERRLVIEAVASG
jgi:hypothetical protein